MPDRFDLSVYLVTDPGLCSRHGVVETARLAVSGGVTLVQLRDPHAETGQLITEARELVGLLRPLGIPLIVNDRVDVALAADADGVHLGQSDMRPRDARPLLGRDRIIGLSIGTLQELEESREDLAHIDYVGAGPFRTTATKQDAGPAIGAEGIARLRAALDLPIVAIGGIGLDEAGAAIAAGADGVAVVSAICTADDPAAAAAALRRRVKRA